jgi:hypothetical protein
MDGWAARRVGLAALVGLASMTAIGALLALSAARVDAGPADLPPDLVTLSIGDEDLRIERDQGRVLLRFTNEIGNRANGPLEISPSAASSGCDADADPGNDRDASQRLFADTNASGAFERDADVVAAEHPVGCMRYHAAHDHWHVLDIATYELRREPAGKIVLRSRKVGFCLTDARLAFPGALTPPTGTYPVNPEGVNGCQSVSVQGISPGWADAYALALPGQALEVTDLPRGRYCLTTRADPTGALAELDEGNNVRRVRLLLRPQRPAVRKLGGPCRG